MQGLGLGIVSGTKRILGIQPPPPPPPPPEPNHAGFDHATAQEYELAHARITIAEAFPGILSNYEREIANGGLWQGSGDQWFNGDNELFASYIEHIRNRKNLEIGSGPFGYLSPCYWIKDRVIIDPLVDQYRAIQIEMTGKTLFGPDVKTHSVGAEVLIPELIGAVDGSIHCRNALDHCEDSLAVLHNITQYAAKGCYLLLWTDIWHCNGLDDGHHNITQRPESIDLLLKGAGFEILKIGQNIREGNEYIEYGRLARKL